MFDIRLDGRTGTKPTYDVCNGKGLSYHANAAKRSLFHRDIKQLEADLEPYLQQLYFLYERRDTYFQAHKDNLARDFDKTYNPN